MFLGFVISHSPKNNFPKIKRFRRCILGSYFYSCKLYCKSLIYIRVILLSDEGIFGFIDGGRHIFET